MHTESEVTEKREETVTLRVHGCEETVDEKQDPISVTRPETSKQREEVGVIDIGLLISLFSSIFFRVSSSIL